MEEDRRKDRCKRMGSNSLPEIGSGRLTADNGDRASVTREAPTPGKTVAKPIKNNGALNSCYISQFFKTQSIHARTPPRAASYIMENLGNHRRSAYQH